MIIGQFCDTYPPAVDGVGRVTLSYCQTLMQLGHQAYYIAPKAPKHRQDYGVPCVFCSSVHVPGELFRMQVPALDRKYRKALDVIPFDIVHAQDPFTSGAEALRIAQKRRIPLVSTFHSKYYDDVISMTHSGLIAREVVVRIVSFYEKCDAVWTVNHATADVLRDYGYRGEILIMENGTDMEQPDPEAEKRMAERMQLKDGIPTLLFVGQHHYKKNLHGVLGACRLLKDAGQPFQLVTAGDGPDFDAIVHEAETLGLSGQCRFLGWMTDRKELMAVYRRADLLVFPSLYDNAPMVLREAAVMGTPGLLVKGSCSAEGVIDGDNGFISPDESAGAIARTILRALPRTAEVGAKARDTIPTRWVDIIRRVETEYQRLIDRM